MFWPTPVANMGERGGRGDLLALVRGMPNKHSGKLWATPSARDWKSGKAKKDFGNARQLSEEVVLFSTPRADGRSLDGGSNSRKRAKADGVWVSGSLNPTWVEWLMGFPSEWTALEDSATRSCLSAPSSLVG